MPKVRRVYRVRIDTVLRTSRYANVWASSADEACEKAEEQCLSYDNGDESQDEEVADVEED